MGLTVDLNFENFVKGFSNKKLSFYTIDMQNNLSGKWFGGILAQNGKIYGIPYASDNILEINPDDDTFSVFGDLTTCAMQGDVKGNKYNGGVLSPDGKIYCFPQNAKYMLVIDPITKTYEYITSYTFSNTIFYGGVLAPNGKIYSTCYNKNLMIEVDYKTKTITEIECSSNGCKGGQLISNTEIMFIPYSGSLVLFFDFINKTFRTKQITLGYQDYSTAVLANEKKVIFIPFMNYKILIYNLENNSTETFENLPSGFKYACGKLAPNGKVYCFPFNTNEILEIDVPGKQIFKHGNFSGYNKFEGAVLASNGKIYGIPFSATYILVIDTKLPSYKQQVLTSSFFNKL